MEETGEVIQVLLRFLARRLVRNPPAPLRVILLSVVVLTYGATGFMYFELADNPQLGWADAIWYSIVTVTTVGYGDYAPASMEGRFLVAGPLMFFGIGLLGYVLSLAASALVEAKTKELHGMADHNLKKHLVLFNFPSLSKVLRVLDELQHDPKWGKDKDVLVVDEDINELPPELIKRGVHFVKGNPTRDETLSRANLDYASHAIILANPPGHPEADNLSIAITLAVEARNGDVNTVVECVDYSTEELLRKAGCDSIVCTTRFDAHFLSNELLNPGVQEVVHELTTNMHGQQLYITEYGGKRHVVFGAGWPVQQGAASRPGHSPGSRNAAERGWRFPGEEG